MGSPAIKPNYREIVLDLFEDLKKWLKPLERLQQYKDDYNLEEMNTNYVNYMLSYKKYRDEEIQDILSNTDYYREVEKFAKENILFDILIDGYAIEVNRASGKNRFLPILPYPAQMKLIEAYDYGKKNILVEKSRRAGASLFMSFFMRRGLIHRRYYTMLTSHQDIDHLDAGVGKDLMGNSTMGRVEFMMNNSIFVAVDWKDKKNSTTKKIDSNTATKRAFKEIIYKTNKLKGTVLGKGTGTGDAVDDYFADEFDVVCDMYPNQAQYFLGAVAPGAERIFIYSTYRSVIYPMYQKRQENDTNHWFFVKLRWQDNPTCNTAWYKWKCSAMDEYAIARELDINPESAIKGRVFKNLEKKHYITEKDFIERFGNIWDEKLYHRAVGGDNGADQNYTLIFIHKRTGLRYYYKNKRVDNLRPKDILNWSKKWGFSDSVFYVDAASKQEHGYKGHSIVMLNKKQGLTMRPVNNKGLLTTHALMRVSIDDDLIWINKDDVVLSNAAKAYRYNYKTQWVEKDAASHTMDGVCYFEKGFFESQSIYTV